MLLVISLAVGQGLFCTMAPGACQAIDGVSRTFGYEFNCFDLHGGWRCRFDKSALPTESNAKNGDSAMFGCRSDLDCIATTDGLCFSKNSWKFFGQGKVIDHQNRKCTCESGPVVFGCVNDSLELKDNKAIDAPSDHVIALPGL